ncbi:hypothetical protein QCA50_018409 [Cerrena zonata]|uniref:Uncharacterized protein n=1 Tax=Cerrena zonata TaxID=2478898 RepID=A0AAW0FMN8_9APHY
MKFSTQSSLTFENLISPSFNEAFVKSERLNLDKIENKLLSPTINPSILFLDKDQYQLISRNLWISHTLEYDPYTSINQQQWKLSQLLDVEASVVLTVILNYDLADTFKKSIQNALRRPVSVNIQQTIIRNWNYLVPDNFIAPIGLGLGIIQQITEPPLLSYSKDMTFSTECTCRYILQKPHSSKNMVIFEHPNVIFSQRDETLLIDYAKNLRKMHKPIPKLLWLKEIAAGIEYLQKYNIDYIYHNMVAIMISNSGHVKILIDRYHKNLYVEKTDDIDGFGVICQNMYPTQGKYFHTLHSRMPTVVKRVIEYCSKGQRAMSQVIRILQGAEHCSNCGKPFHQTISPYQETIHLDFLSRHYAAALQSISSSSNA